MHTITLSCHGLNKEQLLQLLGEALPLPSHYGKNLDALFDCLLEISSATHLILLHFPPIEALRQTLLEAAGENPMLTVTFC